MSDTAPASVAAPQRLRPPALGADDPGLLFATAVSFQRDSVKELMVDSKKLEHGCRIPWLQQGPYMEV